VSLQETAVRRVWNEGRCALNGWLAVPATLSAEAMVRAGWDAVTVDLQHGTADYAGLLSMLPVVEKAGVTPLVRVPWNEPSIIMRALDAGGAAIVVTADHGMKPKHLPDGSPAVVYAQDLLDDWLGAGRARVILPITDPYVVHHGALGSFATAYLPDGADREAVIERLRGVEGMLAVLGREEACERFELPPDRVGDVVMVSGESMTIGTSADRHDLAALKEPLRSHGGLTEQAVPFIVNRVLPLPREAAVLRNFDAFHYAAVAAAESRRDR